MVLLKNTKALVYNSVNKTPNTRVEYVSFENASSYMQCDYIIFFKYYFT